MAEFRSSIAIAATPAEVFAFLVTPEGLTAWMGTEAMLDPQPGGTFAVTIAGNAIRGRYLDVHYPDRVVVSWGHEGSDVLPPGTSRVSFTLTATATGTQVDLVHSGLPDPAAAGHRDGWQHFLPRLRLAAAGMSPGPDDWVPLPQRSIRDVTE